MKIIVAEHDHAGLVYYSKDPKRPRMDPFWSVHRASAVEFQNKSSPTVTPTILWKQVKNVRVITES